jgi:hypothetical protein
MGGAGKGLQAINGSMPPDLYKKLKHRLIEEDSTFAAWLRNRAEEYLAQTEHGFLHVQHGDEGTIRRYPIVDYSTYTTVSPESAVVHEDRVEDKADEYDTP